MSQCNHINDIEQDTEYICREWLGEEGCDFKGIVEAQGCSGTWYITCPGCKGEIQNDYL